MNERAASSWCSLSSAVSLHAALSGEQAKNSGTRDVQSFHLHNLKGAPTLHFPGCLVSISSCCPAHQWVLQGEHSEFLLLQDTKAAKPMPCARTWQIGAAGKPDTLQPRALKRLKKLPLSRTYTGNRTSVWFFSMSQACPINSTAGRRKDCRMCKYKSSSWSGRRKNTEMGLGVARPRANTAVHVRQGKITPPDPAG